MFWPVDEITLWHGTDDHAAFAIVAGGARVMLHRSGRKTKTWDFGPGFYTTTRRDTAADWAVTTARLTGRSGQPMLVRFDVDILDFAELPKMAFGEGGSSNTLFWTFVTSCRQGVTPHHPVKGWNFQAVVGPVCATVAPHLGDCGLVPEADQISFHDGHGIKFLNSWPRNFETP